VAFLFFVYQLQNVLASLVVPATQRSGCVVALFKVLYFNLADTPLHPSQEERHTPTPLSRGELHTALTIQRL